MSAKTLRCAIYTRKSTEEGLDQAFNSLHAQREACEAYVKSQAGEGWKGLKTVYDDGGFSGGNMERPALARLLADVDRGLVDVVVVYKVDRLTRSLADFAKIVERFDARGVSFVSVTQAFNTTSSMGRLTLNVLLSFAQFEREVTGERIRDKIALSKQRGMWMGGVVPLGYDAKDRELVVNPGEAETVQAIFRRYLELASVHTLCAELERTGVRSKRWIAHDGQPRGAQVIGRGALAHMLQNRLYLGQIVHKGQAYPGRHCAIIAPELFEAVQSRMRENRVARSGQAKARPTSPLTGLLFDADGRPMTPTFSYGRKGSAYRYYVSADLLVGKSKTMPGDDAIRRVGALALESFLVELLRRIAGRANLAAADFPGVLSRVELRRADTQLVLVPEGLFGPDHPELAFDDLQGRLAEGERAVWDGDGVRISLPVRMRLRGGRTWFADASGAPLQRKARPRRDPPLAKLLRTAHQQQLRLRASPFTPTADLQRAEVGPAAYYRRLGRLAFLAPDIQEALLAGDEPAGLTAAMLITGDPPLAWADQRIWLKEIVRGRTRI